MATALRDAESLSGPERYSIAVVTVNEASFPGIRRYLAPTFKAVLASTEEQIKAAVDDPGVQGLVMPR